MTFDAQVSDSWVEQSLARLGYPGFAYRKKAGPKRNPVELMLKALDLDELDPRLAEALPWLLLRFEGLDYETLCARAKAKDLQNRLGFVVALARAAAQQAPRYRHRTSELHRFEAVLEPSRLAREDTFGRRETNHRVLAWLRDNRSRAARHWNLLTDLKVEHLAYANQDPGTVAELPA
jgi:hypothetical protein